MHCRIKVHFGATFWENSLIVFFCAFQIDDYICLYYLPKNLDNGFQTLNSFHISIYCKISFKMYENQNGPLPWAGLLPCVYHLVNWSFSFLNLHPHPHPSTGSILHYLSIRYLSFSDQSQQPRKHNSSIQHVYRQFVVLILQWMIWNGCLNERVVWVGLGMGGILKP